MNLNAYLHSTSELNVTEANSIYKYYKFTLFY